MIADRYTKMVLTVIAVALSSQHPSAGFPVTLELTRSRLPKRSWVKISQVRTLAVERIGRRLGRASAGALRRRARARDAVRARRADRDRPAPALDRAIMRRDIP